MTMGMQDDRRDRMIKGCMVASTVALRIFTAATQGQSGRASSDPAHLYLLHTPMWYKPGGASGYRQAEGHRGASARVAVDPYAALMGVYDALGDGETQPGPAAGAGARAVGPPEAVEDVGQVLRGDAGTGV